MTTEQIEAIEDAVDWLNELRERMVQEKWHSLVRFGHIDKTIATLKAMKETNDHDQRTNRGTEAEGGSVC